MLLSFPPHHRILRGLVTFTLTLWLGGLGCAVGCEMPTTGSHRVTLETSSAEQGCSMGGGHDRRHQANVNDDGGRLEMTATPGELSPCPLVGQTADLARKVRPLDAPQVLAGSDHVPTPSVEPYPDAITARLPIRDRGSTYLRCCVFLI